MPSDDGAPVPRRPRCFVVEDNNFMRHAGSDVLTRDGCDVVAVFSTVRDAAAWFAPGKADVGVFDLDLGSGPTGVDLAVRLRRQQPDLGVVLLTVSADPRVMGIDPANLPLGTRYVGKDRLTDGSELCRAVLSAWASPAADPPDDSELRVPRVDLGDAQMEVLRLIAEGLSNSEIARRRHVTVHAVERAITRLNRQLGVSATSAVSARVELAAYYWRLAGRPAPPAPPSGPSGAGR